MTSKQQKESKGNIKVFVRVRPLTTYELNMGSFSIVDCPNNGEVVVRKTTADKMTKTFAFDQVFGCNSRQIYCKWLLNGRPTLYVQDGYLHYKWDNSADLSSHMELFKGRMHASTQQGKVVTYFPRFSGKQRLSPLHRCGRRQAYSYCQAIT